MRYRLLRLPGQTEQIRLAHAGCKRCGYRRDVAPHSLAQPTPPYSIYLQGTDGDVSLAMPSGSARGRARIHRVLSSSYLIQRAFRSLTMRLSLHVALAGSHCTAQSSHKRGLQGLLAQNLYSLQIPASGSAGLPRRCDLASRAHTVIPKPGKLECLEAESLFGDE